MGRSQTGWAAVVLSALLAGCAANPPAPPSQALREVPAARVRSVEGAQPAVVTAVAPGPVSVPATPATESAVSTVAGPATTWAEVSPKLFPMVLSRSAFAADDPVKELLALSLLDQAMITFVIDLPDRWRFLTVMEYYSWGIGPEDFVGTGLKNLLLASGPPEAYQEQQTGAQVWMYQKGDGFDAARILLVELWEEMAKNLPGTLILAIPARDRLYAFSDADPNLMARMKEITEQEFKSLEYPVTRSWFTLDHDGGLKLYLP